MQATLSEPPPAALPLAPAVVEPPPPPAATAPNQLRIPVDAIDEPPQARKFFDPDFSERLTGAIRSRGQTWPVKVRRGRQPGRYDLVAGGQRLHCCRQAGLSDVWAVVVEGDLKEADILEEQLQENGLRTALRPCEEAEALDRLRQLRGCTLTELAKLVQFNLTHVSRRIGLLRYPPAQRARVDAGDVPEIVAVEIAKVAKEQDRLALFERALQGSWTSERAIAEVSALKKRRKPRQLAAQAPKRVVLQLGARSLGTTLAIKCPDDLPQLTTELIRDWLEFALKEVRAALRKKVTVCELPGWIDQRNHLPAQGMAQSDPARNEPKPPTL
jgi:ParB/RepB/Spo0J family partition protein